MCHRLFYTPQQPRRDDPRQLRIDAYRGPIKCRSRPWPRDLPPKGDPPNCRFRCVRSRRFARDKSVYLFNAHAAGLGLFDLCNGEWSQISQSVTEPVTDSRRQTVTARQSVQLTQFWVASAYIPTGSTGMRFCARMHCTQLQYCMLRAWGVITVLYDRHCTLVRTVDELKYNTHLQISTGLSIHP